MGREGAYLIVIPVGLGISCFAQLIHKNGLNSIQRAINVIPLSPETRDTGQSNNRLHVDNQFISCLVSC